MLAGRRIGERLEQLEGMGEVACRLAIRRALSALYPGETRIVERVARVVALAVMMGERAQMVIEPVAVQRF